MKIFQRYRPRHLDSPEKREYRARQAWAQEIERARRSDWVLS